MKTGTKAKLVQRTLSFILSFALLVSGFAAMRAYAADCLTYNTLDEIPEDLDIFTTISKGSISAIEEDGVWYYQFARQNYSTVRIKASAFVTYPGNAYLVEDNRALTRESNKNPKPRICYYNDMKYQAHNHYDTYATSMYRFKLEVQGLTDDEIILKARLMNHVSFTYNTKVERKPGDFEAGVSSYGVTDFYVTPSTRMQYEAALQRTSTVKEISPIVTLEITNTGDNAVCFSTYTLCGKGESSDSLNVNDYISVAAAVETIAGAVKGPKIAALDALVNIIGGVTTKLEKKSRVYNTGESTALSIAGNAPILKVQYESPIKLINDDDYVQVTTKLSASKISTKSKGVNAQFKVAFSFK